MNEKLKGYPEEVSLELAGFLDYHAATDAYVAAVCQKLGPKDYRLPDENEALRKLKQSLKGRLMAIERGYADVLERGDASTWESLLEAVNDWKSKAGEALEVGLKGQLGNSLLSAVKHDFIDATRKAYRKHEVIESQIDAQRKSQGEEVDTPFFDTRPSPEPTPEELMLLKEPIDLKSLGLDLDRLKPSEISAIKCYLQLFKDGYDLSSKDEANFKQALGEDYNRIKVAFNRAKANLKKP